MIGHITQINQLHPVMDPDQNEAQRAKKNFWEARPPPPHLRFWRPAPPLSEGLDPPLTSGGPRGGARGPGPPSFLDQNEAQRAEKNFFEAGPPLISRSG